MDYQNCLNNLPNNICFRPSGRGGYGIWSLEDIPCKTAFGPYGGLFIDGTELKGGCQWKVERENNIITLDGSNNQLTSWLRYVNNARCKEEQNMVVVQNQSEVFYVTSKDIRENTELLVWYQESSISKRKIREEVSSDQRLLEENNAANTEAAIGNLGSEGSRDEDNLLATNSSHLQALSSLAGNKASLMFNKETNIPRPMVQSNLLTPENENFLKPMIQKNFKGYNLYECNLCHMQYLIKGFFIKHLKTHNINITNIEEKQYQCNICNKSFKTKHNLNSHEVTHSTHRLFKCEICPKSFKSSLALKVHKLQHSGERRFECQVCGTRFYQKCHLTRHNRKHTGERPYECKLCSKKLFCSTGLKKHMIMHARQAPNDFLIASMQIK